MEVEHDKNEDSFVSWLSDVTIIYKSLSDENRNALLEQMIAISEPNQLNFLSSHLPTLTCRDFISYLPLEIITTILMRLSGKELFKLCQVCKSWKERIDSLAELWQVKAFQVGVDVQAIALKYPEHNKRSRMYKASYSLAVQFMYGLKQQRLMMKIVPGVDVHGYEDNVDVNFTDDSIVIGNCCDGLVEIYSVPEWSHIHSVSTNRKFNLILLYKDSQVYTSSHRGKVMSLTVGNKSRVSADGDLDDHGDDEEEDDDDDPDIHLKHKFVGHTSTAVGLDVTESNGSTFVITGACDKTIKVWKLHNTVIDAELFMTLENTHTSVVTQIHVLPPGENGVLRFISFGTKDLFMWSLDVQTRHIESFCCVTHEQFRDELVSCNYDIAKPNYVFTSQWSSDTKLSTLKSYDLWDKGIGLEMSQEWILPEKGLKACVLGVGSRFAFLMCAISLQDFQLFDFAAGCVMTTFTTCSRFRKPPIKLYDKSWLDGFLFDKKKKDRKPMLLGLGLFEGMTMVTFNFPVLGDEIGDMD